VVRRRLSEANSQVAGFRYFNVYGPREQHKGRMASVAFHHYQQYSSSGKVKLFEGCDGYGDGEQSRDFVYVGDVIDVNMFFLDHPEQSGIFNLGTGRPSPSTTLPRQQSMPAAPLMASRRYRWRRWSSRASSNTSRFPMR